MTPEDLSGFVPGCPVLVTGASGFTGTLLVQRLVNAGLKVRAIARPSSSIEKFADLNIEWYSGQVFDKQTVERAADQVQYIFHLAAAYREPGASQDVYQQVHVESTRLLADCALRNQAFKRFIHVSTVGVHGHVDSIANESQSFAPADLYQSTKADGERYIRELAERRNLPLTVIRPTAIYGPGDRRLLKVFKMASGPIFPVVGSGKCLYHLIHVEDLTDALILAALHPRAEGEVFICGDVQHTSLFEMVEIISEVYGRKVSIVRVPQGPVFLLADLCEAIFKPLGLTPPIFRRRVTFYTHDRAFDTSKIQNLLGFKPAYSTRQGLSDTAKWYLAQGWVR